MGWEGARPELPHVLPPAASPARVGRRVEELL